MCVYHPPRNGYLCAWVVTETIWSRRFVFIHRTIWHTRHQVQVCLVSSCHRFYGVSECVISCLRCPVPRITYKTIKIFNGTRFRKRTCHGIRGLYSTTDGWPVVYVNFRPDRISTVVRKRRQPLSAFFTSWYQVPWWLASENGGTDMLTQALPPSKIQLGITTTEHYRVVSPNTRVQILWGVVVGLYTQ